VFIKILELALVMLSRDEPAMTIPEFTKFFDKSLSVLMTYATEGKWYVCAFGVVVFSLKKFVFTQLDRSLLCITDTMSCY